MILLVDPAVLQLFRKDLISAMKLPDNEPLEADDYWTVTDTWKQEWEKGVQVSDMASMIIGMVIFIFFLSGSCQARWSSGASRQRHRSLSQE